MTKEHVGLLQGISVRDGGISTVLGLWSLIIASAIPCAVAQPIKTEQGTALIEQSLGRLEKRAADAPTDLEDDEKKKALADIRKDDQLVLSTLASLSLDPSYALRARLRLAHVRARIDYADARRLLEDATSDLDALKEREPLGDDTDLRILAAEVYLDAGLPWRARAFVQPLQTYPPAKKINADIGRVLRILEDDSPRAECAAADIGGRAICEQLRHLMAVPPARAGLYSEINERSSQPRTYPRPADKGGKRKKGADDDGSDIADVAVPHVNQVPLLSFIAGMPRRPATNRVLRAKSLPSRPLAGEAKIAFDRLARTDGFDARAALANAVRGDKDWRKILTLGFDNGSGPDVTEVVEVRRTPAYVLVMLKSISAPITQTILGLLQTPGNPNNVSYFLQAGSLNRHVVRKLSATVEDGIMLSSVGGSGQWMEVSIVNPRTARILAFTEYDVARNEGYAGYYHGTAHVADFDYDGVAELILTRAEGDGRFESCNQCPRRHRASIWKLAPDLSSASRVGEQVSWNDLSFATGGPVGLGPESAVSGAETTLFQDIRDLAKEELKGAEFDARAVEVLHDIGVYEAAEDPRSAISAYLQLAEVLSKRQESGRSLFPALLAYLSAAQLYARDDRLSEARNIFSLVQAQFDGTNPEVRRRLEEVRFEIARASGSSREQFKALAALESNGQLSLENVYRKLLYLSEIGDVDGAEVIARSAALRDDFWTGPGSYEVTFQRAVALFRKDEHARALDILLVLGRYAAASWTSRAFSRLYLLATHIALTRGEHAIARHLLDTALAHMPGDLWTTDGPFLLSTFAAILGKNGQIKQAETVLAAAIRGAEEFKGARLAVPTDLLAQFAETRRRTEDAIQQSKRALAALASTQSDIVTEPHKLSFVKSNDELANEQLARLQRLNASPSDLFEAVEAWRSQVLRSMIGERTRDLVLVKLPGELIQHVRGALGQSTALVSYFLGGPWPAAILVTAEDVRLVRLPATRDVIRAARRRLDLHLVPVSAATIEAITHDRVPPAMIGELEALYAALIAPLEIAPGVKSLVIVPDGEELYGLPWNALSAPDKDKPAAVQAGLRPLARDFVIRVLPSAHLLATAHPSTQRSAALLGSSLGVSRDALQRFMPMYQRPRPTGIGFLSKLPGVSDEIRAIQATLSAASYKVQSPLIITDERQADSVPLFLQQQMADKRLIHIAGHGLFDSTDNMASALFLGGNNERGVVRASDLLIADLRDVDLVALSACQTGDVSVRAGQEAFGFVRALLMAGARRAIVSQWKVDDAATQKWFTAMYHHLAEHDDIESAYQSATLQMAQEKQHPFYWAAFTLYSRGEGSANPNGPEVLQPPTAVTAPAPVAPVQAGIPQEKGATKPEAPQKKTSKSKAPDWKTEVFSR